MTEPEYRFNENGTEIRDAFNRYIKYGPSGINESEFRAMSADSDVGGGYLVLPTELAKEILRGLDNELQIRQLARTFQLPNADSLGVPTLGDDFGDVTFTAELATGQEDSSLDIQRRDLHPHPMARRIKVSNKLLRVSSMNPEVFVRERMTQVCGQVLENAYLNGTGANQPLGIFVNSEHGISSDRDLACSTQTAVKADDLIGAVGMLKQQYRKKAVWIAHRDFETAVRKLKTGDGDYIWKAGLEANGNTLLGFPIVLSEYSPNTFSSGRYVAVLANMDYYWIADALSMQITVLRELYAETNQQGYIIRHETDGMPTWQDAFVRLKMA
jgi:HK97 family phage major capsid protein